VEEPELFMMTVGLPHVAHSQSCADQTVEQSDLMAALAEAAELDPCPFRCPYQIVTSKNDATSIGRLSLHRKVTVSSCVSVGVP
jgi:hypothetical protein